jgi:hypothetical protein
VAIVSVPFPTAPAFSSMDHTAMPIYALSPQCIAHRLWRRQPALNDHRKPPAAMALPASSPHRRRSPCSASRAPPSAAPEACVLPSSPSANAGCDAPAPPPAPASARFNPHPARTPGATPALAFVWHTRNEFQPSPSANAGCDLLASTTSFQAPGFQPSPSANAGCDYWRGISSCLAFGVSTLTQRERRVRLWHNGSPAVRTKVSTLTQRERRVRLAKKSAAKSKSFCFNPHPARTPGATLRGLRPRTFVMEFQPSPSANAGCDGRASGRALPISRFNPHPARTPGATHMSG